MAEEITQNVFVALSRKAPRLMGHETLAGWLHRTAILESKARIRMELRRRRREESAASLAAVLPETSTDGLNELAPLLDEALLNLREKDRLVVSGILREYRLVEGSKVQSIPDHLPGVADQPGKKLTIRVEPIAEIASAMRSRFESAVVEVLGKQRGEIVLRASETWLREQFQTDQKESRVVSVLRMDDGRYQVVSKSGASFLSVGGVSDLSPYLPVHLRALFDSLTE